LKGLCPKKLVKRKTTRKRGWGGGGEKEDRWNPNFQQNKRKMPNRKIMIKMGITGEKMSHRRK
jgi:hypothetical protein